MMSKVELLNLLWGVANENPEALKVRALAAKEKNVYWLSDDWIYIKDIEVSLKMLLKEVKTSRLVFDGKIADLIMSGNGEDYFSDNDWALEKIKDCRTSLEAISNPV